MLCYIIWNAFVFLTMRIDKCHAQKGQWRISEANLLFKGFIFGAIGLYVGMKVFHHKTSHAKFVIGVPLLIVINFLEIGLLYYVTFIY
ncbi:MAG: DUF1294 domain-containing protein [Desulfitobacteriaceae bacterium]